MADAVIIGGGPAGSAAAIALNEIGLKVTLFEKARFPRPKLCGGFLSPESLTDLERLGVLETLRRQGAIPIRRVLVSSPGGQFAESPLSGEGLSVSRAVLDTILLERAQRSGVDIQEGIDGLRHSPAADWTIIASGRKRTAGAEGRAGSSEDSYFGIQTSMEDIDGLSDQVELHLLPEGYVGLVRQGTASVNLCALIKKEVLRDEGRPLDNLLRSWAVSNPLLAQRLRSARRIGTWMSVGPVEFGLNRLSTPRTLYSGDAAYVVDPFVGEGMTMGLRSAWLLQDAFSKSGRIEQNYERLWHEQFDAPLRLGTWTRRMIFRPYLQNVVVDGLRRWPALLRKLSEGTRTPHPHEYLKPHPYRRAV